jgi:DnaJ like chaperone protein
VDALRQLVVALGLRAELTDEYLSLGGDTLEDAYRVLGLTPDATADEVRRAYRRLVVENHPDKVAHLGEEVKAAATKKLQQITEAKERIDKAMGK